ncbi:sensor histidine kinase [Magnetospirillum sulfuroxidans]|uniref:histidine kinase n=1 Tax=Magnetospirillum sulfuroxidans TaxID=611300 RepID=A0ABS5IDF6_9PROT|nr:response regulator [Magnetospirillum sulfuroxidans]MBR9972464.1 response regulator [Magnetospirillum sulfuroxidans]
MTETSGFSASGLEGAPFVAADILVVDDSPSNLSYLSGIISEQGHMPRLAISGKLALTAAKAEIPDLILLDVMMPEIDGFEVCRRLKSDPRTRDIPVIFVSSMSDPQEKVRAFTAGGVDYVTKPFATEEIVARIRTHLEISRMRTRLLEQNAELEEARRSLETRLDEQTHSTQLALLNLIDKEKTLDTVESDLQHTVEALSRSHAELDRFAAIAAHDLQEPSRAVILFAQLLQRRLGEAMDTTTIEYLEYIVGAARQMMTLVQDLLAYTERFHQNYALERVDCDKVLKIVLKKMEPALVTSAAKITSRPLPTVVANEAECIELFEQLIGNSIKFSRHGAPPEIEIAATVDGEECEFTITDNGIGIEEIYLERIFGLFMRLHTRQRYPGNGVGLALCKTIVESLGGSIKATSEADKGTTIHFSLPVTDEQV